MTAAYISIIVALILFNIAIARFKKPPGSTDVSIMKIWADEKDGNIYMRCACNSEMFYLPINYKTEYTYWIRDYLAEYKLKLEGNERVFSLQKIDKTPPNVKE